LHRIDHGGEFQQQVVTHGLGDTAAVFLNCWINQLRPVARRDTMVPASSAPIRRE